LVGARGFEPPTPCAQGRCATRLRYAPTENDIPILNQFSLVRFPAPALPNLFATKLTSASAQVAALVWGKCLVGVQDPEASPEDKCQDPNLAPARDPAWALAWVEGMEFGEMS
jgi:hypothetical protein